MAPKTITVSDADGKEQTETVGNDRGLEKKLERYGAACLVHPAHGNIDDFESLVDGGTYKLGPPSTKEEEETVLEKIDELKTMISDAITEERDMSKANTAFATSLLTGLSITWQKTAPNMNVVVGSAVGNFEWAQELKKGGKAKISEHDGTPAALEWLFGKLEQGLSVDGEVLGIRDVKGKALTPVKADRKLAKGKSDGCIAEESVLALCDQTKESFYTYGIALVEMKTNRTFLNKAQMLLQLSAFSRESSWEQATMLLGTDGNTKWYLLHFNAFNSMSLTQYKDGRQCMNDFELLLKSTKTRAASLKSSKRAKLASVPEEQLEQDLTGIPSPGSASLPGTDGVGGGQEAVDKAMENEAFLHRLANALAESPLSDGVRPTLPEWSLAKNVVPSYYA
ncbi:MAG: hypothetical protein SGILL_010508 [Bacillariaceae sp.]